MAYACFYVGTSGCTSAAGLGLTAGWWVELPDAFPPIHHVSTTSVAVGSDGQFEGCLVTCYDTTTVGHTVHMTVRGIDEWAKGTKWLRFRSDPALSNQGADKVERLQTKIELFYRSEDEVGTITV
ncbi:MAG: hypothetical protein WC565_03305 [Parcubacteria group bacterium]|jgi:hypothetical protein